MLSWVFGGDEKGRRTTSAAGSNGVAGRATGPPHAATAAVVGGGGSGASNPNLGRYPSPAGDDRTADYNERYDAEMNRLGVAFPPSSATAPAVAAASHAWGASAVPHRPPPPPHPSRRGARPDDQHRHRHLRHNDRPRDQNDREERDRHQRQHRRPRPPAPASQWQRQRPPNPPPLEDIEVPARRADQRRHEDGDGTATLANGTEVSRLTGAGSPRDAHVAVDGRRRREGRQCGDERKREGDADGASGSRRRARHRSDDERGRSGRDDGSRRRKRRGIGGGEGTRGSEGGGSRTGRRGGSGRRGRESSRAGRRRRRRGGNSDDGDGGGGGEGDARRRRRRGEGEGDRGCGSGRRRKQRYRRSSPSSDEDDEEEEGERKSPSGDDDDDDDDERGGGRGRNDRRDRRRRHERRHRRSRRDRNADDDDANDDDRSSSPTYIVSEDSESNLMSLGAATPADAAGPAAGDDFHAKAGGDEEDGGRDRHDDSNAEGAEEGGKEEDGDDAKLAAGGDGKRRRRGRTDDDDGDEKGRHRRRRRWRSRSRSPESASRSWSSSSSPSSSSSFYSPFDEHQCNPPPRGLSLGHGCGGFRSGRSSRSPNSSPLPSRLLRKSSNEMKNTRSTSSRGGRMRATGDEERMDKKKRARGVQRSPSIGGSGDSSRGSSACSIRLRGKGEGGRQPRCSSGKRRRKAQYDNDENDNDRDHRPSFYHPPRKSSSPQLLSHHRRDNSNVKHHGSIHRGHDRHYRQRGDDGNIIFYGSRSTSRQGRRRSSHSNPSRHSDNSNACDQRKHHHFNVADDKEKDSKKKKENRAKRRHRFCTSNRPAARGGMGDSKQSDDSSSSSHDDTVGHYHGKPGTLIHRGKHEYRIIRDVGMGTFGRVVQCEKISGGAWGGSSGDGSRMSTSRHNRDHGRHSSGCNIARNNNSAVVAIKIVRNVRRYYESALIEADINERVNREQSRQNKDLCARMLDRFGLPSGHYCLVFECLGRSLYDYLKMYDYCPFPMYCVRDFSRQLLEALDFIHGFGLIHTDLKPENILLMNNEETIYRSYNHTASTASSRNHLSTNRRRRDHDVQRVPASTKVKLIDFGGATYDNEKKSSIVNTRQYRAPEVILGWGWSYPSDLWSAGCIIAELYTGELLFGTHDNAEHLALIERSVGPFRRDLLSLSDMNRGTPAGDAGSLLVRECFDSRGWHRINGVLSTRSIEHVRNMVPVEALVLERDRPSGLGRLIRSLLTIDPKHRVTAREALVSPFFSQLGH